MSRKTLSLLTLFTVSLSVSFAGPIRSVELSTRGIGVYPGDPREDFSSSLVAAAPGRRDLALHRAATQSSAYDYNLTSQLITDGIKTAVLPRWYSISTGADGGFPKHSQALLVDDNIVSTIDVDEPGWIGFELGGGAEPFEVDRVEIGLRKRNWVQEAATTSCP
jgi:hypothetical protein